MDVAISRTQSIFKFLPALVFGAGLLLFPIQVSGFGVSGSFLSEIQHETRVGSGDASDHFIFSRIESAVKVDLVNGLAIEAAGTFAPTNRFTGNGIFEGEGLYLEEIKAVFSHPFGSFFGGKFNPNFGIAWAETIGIWGRQFPEQYEIIEKIGFGGSLALDLMGVIQSELTVSTFFSDTTFLSRSLVNDRGQTRLSSGGASNTESLFSSFSIASDTTFDRLGLTVHSAIRILEKGAGGVGDEIGGVLGVQRDIAFGPVSASPVVEVVVIDNYDGTSERRYYYTAGSDVRLNQWIGSASYTFLSGFSDDHHFQLTGGYEFWSFFSVEAGYKLVERGGSTNHFIGFLTHFGFDGSLRL